MRNGTEPREKISALADGELASHELDAVLASLRQPEARKEWDIYHQIGDVLRSDDMAVHLSSDFATRMKARLDAEPVILAPAAQPAKQTERASEGTDNPVKRYAVPGIAAALAVFTAYLVAPQFNTGESSASDPVSATSVLASASSNAVGSTPSAPVLSIGDSGSAHVSTHSSQEGVVIRDPSIDEYLIAHQRYSPSLYDTSQFVRSAAFETDPAK